MLVRFLYILLVLSIALPVQAASPYGRFHALVIGNENYRHLKTLNTPIEDAEAVAELLQDQYGFDVELLPDATWKQTMRAISGLRVTANQESDNLLIYYAGHGYLNKKTGVEYWQPVDAERDNDIYWIPTSRITSMLKEIRAKHVLVVADSCYSGSLLTRDSGAKLPDGSGLDELLRRMQERRSRTALTSGGEEPVWDAGGGNHSVFAKAFLDALRENRKILDGYTIFDRIRRPVALNAPQTPQYGDIRMTGHEWGDFLLVPKELQNIEIPDFVASLAGFATRDNSRQNKEPQQGDPFIDPTTGMELVYIPKGCFQMGQTVEGKQQIIAEAGQETYDSYYEDELPRHKVCVDGFWMGKYEMTQGQWKQIMGKNPAKFKKGDKYPVEQVSWEDVQKFIGELNKRAGKKYRLPTEAEWEYAARAGTTTVRHWGNDISCDKAMYDNYSETDNCAEYVRKRGFQNGSTAPVGKYPENDFHLHDMLGNVWEWCADWYDEKYYAECKKHGVTNNPVGPSSGSDRVIRGGSWSNDPRLVRSANRLRNTPGYRYFSLGFRLALPDQ
ncbi:MAG: SUMF1/EgtB/PvdO family nonheme iron enzyme [Candidatus Electrothrix sp. GW3-4]|uniref:SUMF1/EgtB/PvdO family nonheme iron enzyme n=1 Tax=Candidatus Electrothrix sp. GW3-4 TaxID=3126740 RepID=UPI0030CB9844